MGKLSSFHILSITILISFILVALFLLILAKRKSSILIVGLSLFLILFILSGGPSEINRRTIETRWGAFAPGITLLEDFETRYQNISIGRISDQYSVYSNGEVLVSFPDTISSKIEANLIACQHPDPDSALILGAGAETLVSPL